MGASNNDHYTRFEPWFGDWPPEFKGESEGVEMEDSKRDRWMSRIPFIGAFLVGCALLGLSMFFPLEWQQSIAKDFAIAFLSAAVIGGIIELTFVTRLARHVFEIAFGHILPPEISQEVKWVYTLPLLVEDYRHDFIITRHPQNAEKVIMNEQWTRMIRNISHKKEDLTNGAGIQEWFHHEGKSLIKSFTITHGKDTLSLANDKVHKDWNNNPPTVGVSAEKIPLNSKETCTVVAEVEEIKYNNDQTYSFFGIAAKNPYITVKVPEGFGYNVTFANRKQGELENLGNGHHRLNGLLLPLQAIRIRWWEINHLKEFIEKESNEKSKTVYH